jgi:hypothetical protein
LWFHVAVPGGPLMKPTKTYMRKQLAYLEKNPTTMDNRKYHHSLSSKAMECKTKTKQNS